MNDLLRLILAVTQGVSALGPRPATERVVWRTGLALAAIGFAAMALACLLLALWVLSDHHLGGVAATLIIAGVLGVLALGSLLLLSYRPAPAQPTGNPMPALVIAEAARLISAHKVAALLAAAVTGLVLANRDTRKSG